MTIVNFLQDYRGVLTDEMYYQVGQQIELSSRAAQILAARGVVEIVPVLKPEPEPEPKTPPAKRTRKKANAK